MISLRIIFSIFIFTAFSSLNLVNFANAGYFTEDEQKRFDDFLIKNKSILDNILSELKNLEGLEARILHLIKKIESNPNYQQRHAKIATRVLGNLSSGLKTWGKKSREDVFEIQAKGGMNKDAPRVKRVYTRPTRDAVFVERDGIKTAEDFKDFLDFEALLIWHLRGDAGNIDFRYGPLNTNNDVKDGELITINEAEFLLIKELAKELGKEKIKGIFDDLEARGLDNGELGVLLYILIKDKDTYDQMLDFLSRLNSITEKIYNLADEKFKQINKTLKTLLPPKKTGSLKSVLKDRVTYSSFKNDLQDFVDTISLNYGTRFKITIPGFGGSGKVALSPLVSRSISAYSRSSQQVKTASIVSPAKPNSSSAGGGQIPGFRVY